MHFPDKATPPLLLTAQLFSHKFLRFLCETPASSSLTEALACKRKGLQEGEIVQVALMDTSEHSCLSLPLKLCQEAIQCQRETLLSLHRPKRTHCRLAEHFPPLLLTTGNHWHLRPLAQQEPVDSVHLSRGGIKLGFRAREE